MNLNKQIIDGMEKSLKRDKEIMTDEDFIEAHRLIFLAKFDNSDRKFTDILRRFSNLINRV